MNTHCYSYVCTLKSGCVCRCDACYKTACSSCGSKICPTCGKSLAPALPEPQPYIPPPALPYIPYIPYPIYVPPINWGWYCDTCMMYHPYGWTCFNVTSPLYPYITITSGSGDYVYTTTGSPANANTANYQISFNTNSVS